MKSRKLRIKSYISGVLYGIVFYYDILCDSVLSIQRS